MVHLPLVNAIWASSWLMMPDGRIFLDGVTILGRGHFARREKTGRMQVGRYWRSISLILPRLWHANTPNACGRSSLIN